MAKEIKNKSKEENITITRQTKIKSFFSKSFNNRYKKLKVKYKKDPKKFVVAASAIIGLFLCLVGSSYAYLIYVSKTDNSTVINAGTLALKFANEENSIVLDGAVPMSDEYGLKNGAEYSFSITNTGNISAKYVINLDNVCSLTKNYTIGETTTTPDVCIPDKYIKVGIQEEGEDYRVLDYEEIANELIDEEGNVTTTIDEYVLASGTLYKNQSKNYKMKIWLDYHTPNTYNAQGGKTIIYAGKLSLDYEQGSSSLDESGANKPQLLEGMIPVFYDETNNVWRKADENNSNIGYKWYDYNNKMWANTVTVVAESSATSIESEEGPVACEGSSCTRTDYINADLGSVIPMSDILTMQVWIPRYKYKVWNFNEDGTATSNPRKIEIIFEKANTSTGEISCTDSLAATAAQKSEICKLRATNATCTNELCNKRTYTHPAFTLGDEELTGFWMGKFELGGTIDSLLVKPNIATLVNQTVSAFESSISAMSNTGNKYGISSTIDTHLIRNSEWGAVAYLSHSEYGAEKNIGLNNYGDYMTGCGAAPESIIEGVCNEYNTKKGILASTTSNVYGVYDMSGGGFEYTMSNIVSPDGTTMISGNSQTENSGYTGKVNTSESYSGVVYPSNKYMDKYSYGTSGAERMRSKLGDGIKEVYNDGKYGWYGDYSAIANNTNPWFVRGGGYCLEGGCAGIFNSDAYYGSAYKSVSSRIIMTE